MGHFEDLEDLGPKTSVSVLGIRPGPRSELKTLDRLAATAAAVSLCGEGEGKAANPSMSIAKMCHY